MLRTTLLLCLLLVPAIPVTGLTRNEITTLDERQRLVIGVHIADMGAPLATQLGLEQQQGILITHVVPGLPADRAGVQQYDVITAVQGEPVTSRSSLAKALNRAKAGDVVPLTLLRQARAMELGVEVIADPDEQPDEQSEAVRHAMALALLKQATLVKPTQDAAAIAADEARRLLEAGEAEKAQHYLALQARAELVGANLRVFQESLARSRSRQNQALEHLHAEADTISDRLHRHLKELLGRHQSISDEEVVQTETSMQKAAQAFHDAIASVHDHLKAREMQIIERGNSLPDVVVGREDWRPGRWASARTHADTDVEDRLKSIDDRLARIEKALEEMRERRTD